MRALRFQIALLRCALVLLTLLLPAAAQATQTITLVAEDNWYPYSAQVNAQPQGFAVDIVRAAYASQHIDLKLISMPYARCLRDVKDGVQIGCFDSLKDASLAQQYLFHQQPLFQAEISIYANSNIEVTPAQLLGKKVGLTNGYTYGNFVESTTAIARDVANSDLLNLRKTLAGRTEYSLVYTRVYEYLATINSDLLALNRVGRLTVDDLYVSFSLKHPDAKQAALQLDLGLQEIHRNGEYERIEASWFGHFIEPNALPVSKHK